MICDECFMFKCYDMRIEAYKRGYNEFRFFCPECVIQKGYKMAEMKSICFRRHGTSVEGPDRTQSFTYGIMRFFLDMKWIVIELDDVFGLLFNNEELMSQNSCCANIQTYLRANKEVLGFCTRQARINGQVVCVLVIDPNVDLSGASDTGPVGTESVGREPDGQWYRTGLVSKGSVENGSGPERKGLIPVDAGEPEMVSANDGQSVGTARKTDDWLLSKRI
jgi:hypothetical protein